MKPLTRTLLCLALVPMLAAGTATAQVAINHATALAGNVTPGDAAGYPITISTPGSYKLMSNLVVPDFKNGIEIVAEGVTLDLNGFTIKGSMQCHDTYANPHDPLFCNGPIQTEVTGIKANLHDGAVIRNGRVTGFALHGINMAGGILEDVQVDSNGVGIHIAMGTTGLLARPARVSGVRATLNRQIGLKTRHALIERSLFARNTAALWGNNFVLADSFVHRNVEKGLWIGGGPIPVLKGSVVRDNGVNFFLGAPLSGGGNLVEDVPF